MVCAGVAVPPERVVMARRYESSSPQAPPSLEMLHALVGAPEGEQLLLQGLSSALEDWALEAGPCMYALLARPVGLAGDKSSI
jgi:hypothetical protein